MKTIRRSEVTIETVEVIVLRMRGDAVRFICPQCAAPVGLVTVDEAAAVAGVSSRTIYRRAEAGSLHFTETPEGRLLICLRSLS